MIEMLATGKASYQLSSSFRAGANHGLTRGMSASWFCSNWLHKYSKISDVKLSLSLFSVNDAAEVLIVAEGDMSRIRPSLCSEGRDSGATFGWGCLR